MLNTEWNLKDLYKSDSEFLKDFELAKKYVKNIEKFRNKLIKNDKKLILEFLLEDTKLDMIIEKLAVYAHLKKDIEGKNATANKNYQLVSDFYSELNQKLAFTKTEMAKLDDKFLNELKNDESFKDYDRYIEDILRYKKHTLSEKEESNMAKLSAFNCTDDIFSILSDIEMNHGSFIDENGKSIELTTGNYNSYLKSQDQEIRKRVMEAYLNAYGRLNMTLANLYISHVKYMNYLADSYNFKSVLDMSTYGEEVSSKIMLKNIENVSKNIKYLQEYFEVKKNILKLNKFYTCDIPMELSISVGEKFEFDEAVQCIKESYEKLGEDYISKFDEALKQGWIDVFPRDGKVSGGYTTSTYNEHPYILLNFDGTSYWTSAITHEFGHAMHSYYSAKAQPYEKADYTLFVAEVASLTNEILLNHYMLKKVTDKKSRIKYLTEFIQLFYLNVYNSSMLAEFELYVHESLQKGEPLTSEDLNNKYLEVCKKYFGKKVEFNKNFEYDWSRRSHFYIDYYLYKYSTGLICACDVAHHIIEDESGEYIKKYKKFLSLGGSLDPVKSLKVAGIDILSDKPYDFAFGMFKSYLKELKELSKEELWL